MKQTTASTATSSDTLKQAVPVRRQDTFLERNLPTKINTENVKRVGDAIKGLGFVP